ncbi:hypothetical protein BG011_000561, partial [Mortierella polycephala]
YDKDTETESEHNLVDLRKARKLTLSDSTPTVFDEETETESEHDMVDPRKACRMTTSNSRSTMDAREIQNESVIAEDRQEQEREQIQICDPLMETLPLDAGTIDETGLIETQESVMNAFADLEGQLEPIDADHDDDLDDDQDSDQYGDQDKTWDGKIPLAGENILEVGRMAARACIFADDFIVKAAKALYIGIDQRINEFWVCENGRLQSKGRPDDPPIKVFHITYSYQHNHAVAIDTDLRAQYLSDEKKATIERLLETGSPVREVLQRMRGNA